MRKVVVYTLISLDGVAEAPEVFVTEFDDAMEENLAAVIGSQDAVVLGRRMFDEWARFWPSSDTVRTTACTHGVGAPKAPQPRLSRMHCLALRIRSSGMSPYCRFAAKSAMSRVTPGTTIVVGAFMGSSTF